MYVYIYNAYYILLCIYIYIHALLPQNVGLRTTDGHRGSQGHGNGQHGPLNDQSRRVAFTCFLGTWEIYASDDEVDEGAGE